MSVTLLPKKTLDRLKKQPRPLADKILAQVADAAVIQANQALDLIEYQQAQAEATTQPEQPMRIVVLDAKDVPDMTHTRILRAAICGREFAEDELNWNSLLVEMAEMIWKKNQLTSIEQLRKVYEHITMINGKDEREYYMYIADLDISVKKTEAHAIAKAMVRTCKNLGWHLDIVVSAPNDEKCIKIWPGEHFRIIMPGTVAQMASYG